MKIDLTDLLYALSTALDIVEHEMIGVQSVHGKHVGYLSMLMARAHGMTGAALSDFVGTAVLHDNAFSEYVREEFGGGSVVAEEELLRRAKLLQGQDFVDFISGSTHSIVGEENIRLFPFRTDVSGIILYHHENADGTGPFHKTAAETSLASQIVHLADTIDVTWNLTTLTEDGFDEICRTVEAQSGKLFSAESVHLFREGVCYSDILRLQRYGAEPLMRGAIPSREEECSNEEIRRLAVLFARIVDCKSSFTRSHSIGVAEKLDRMGHCYGFSEDKCTQLYFAGALHDLGKLVVSNSILEKRGKLDAGEFADVRLHAIGTAKLLTAVRGLEEIAGWASHHHEKLGGTGYPLGLTHKELCFEDRLMTCVDIYQALTEERPYKTAMSHQKAIDILRDMAARGEVDGSIVDDMERNLADLS